MKPQALVLGALLLIAIVLVALRFGAAPSSPQDVPAAADVAATRSAQGGELRPAAVLDSAGVERATVAQPDPNDAVVVEGRVELPGELPADARYEVLALAGRIAPAPANPLDELARLTLCSAPVDASGAFRLVLPRTPGAVYLSVRGRYLYMEREHAFESGDPPREVVLRPRLGGVVRARVQPPAGSELDPSELAGTPLELILAHDARGFAPLRPTVVQRAGLVLDAGALGFEFLAVPPASGLALKIEPTDLAAGRGAPFELRPGATLEVELEVSAGGRVAGVVRDEAAHPLAGCRVEARQGMLLDQGSLGWVVASAETDDDGRYELPAVAAGTTRLGVSLATYLEASTTLEVARGASSSADFVLGRGATLAGRVRWPDAAPAVRADVDVEFDQSRRSGVEGLAALHGAGGEGRTDAEGRFSISGLGQGPFTLRAFADPPGTAPGAAVAPVQRWSARLDGVARNSADLELVLAPPEGILGRVVDDLNRPLERFEVLARSDARNALPGAGSDMLRDRFEDAQGRFLLGGAREGSWQVTVVAEGFGVPEPAPVVLPMEASAELLLVAPRVGSIAGRVLTDDGLPAPGATVSRELTMANVNSAVARLAPPTTAVTDAGGEFRIDDVTPGELSLVAVAEGFAASEPAPVVVAPGETRGELLLTLRLGGTLTGEVFQEDGAAARGCVVFAQVSGTMNHHRATTDAAGRFELEHLTPGAWQVVAMLGGVPDPAAQLDADQRSKMRDAMKVALVEIEEGGETHVVIGAPPANPVRVLGRVLHDGEPVGGVVVSLIREGASGANALRYETTDPDGVFETLLDEAGSHMITVQRTGAGGSDESVDFFEHIPDVELHELELELPLGGISGRVTDAAGEPIPRARITFQADGPLPSGTFLGGRYAELLCDGDGRYTIDWVEPGTYSVAAGGPVVGGVFGADAAPGRLVRSGLRVGADEWLRGIDFELSDGASIEGRVVDALGKPVPRTSIHVCDEAGRLLERFSFLMTDGSGRFRYPGVEPGSYRIIARKGSDQVGASELVRALPDEAAQAQVVLRPGSTLRIRLQDANDEPVRGRILVLDQEGRQWNGLLSTAEVMQIVMHGGFSTQVHSVGPLPPGSYRVRANSGSGPVTEQSVRASGEPELELVLRVDG